MPRGAFPRIARFPALLPGVAAAAIALLLAAALASLPLPARATEPTLAWSDLYDGGASSMDQATAVLAAPNGDLIVGGESADGIDGSDMLIRRLSRANGTVLWSRRTTSFDTNDMALSGMEWDAAGKVIVSGYIRGCVT